ncbi:hypothetical protein H9P43_002062 [Blastocladiella emersonii ATCC 22665]|nr:hypothetical protein H9P43_002062 [Blastocladiella emersonii ATCC 22665]
MPMFAPVGTFADPSKGSQFASNVNPFASADEQQRNAPVRALKNGRAVVAEAHTTASVSAKVEVPNLAVDEEVHLEATGAIDSTVAHATGSPGDGDIDRAFAAEVSTATTRPSMGLWASIVKFFSLHPV